MSRPTAFLFLFTIVCAVSLAACSPAAPSTNADASTPPVAATASPSDSTTATASTHTMVPGEKKIASEQTYMTPAGEEHVGFTLFVDSNGVITDAETNVEGKAPTSIMRQKSFAAELPVTLKGKKLSELTKVDRVGGSSLTTGAFNKALTDLKTQI